MSPSERGLVRALLTRAAEQWAAGNLDRAEEWCRRAWATANDREFLDNDAPREVDR